MTTPSQDQTEAQVEEFVPISEPERSSEAPTKDQNGGLPSQARKPKKPGRRRVPAPNLEELAAQQGVEPVGCIDDLKGDFWPEDENVDEFNEAVERWRKGG